MHTHTHNLTTNTWQGSIHNALSFKEIKRCSATPEVLSEDGFLLLDPEAWCRPLHICPSEWERPLLFLTALSCSQVCGRAQTSVLPKHLGISQVGLLKALCPARQWRNYRLGASSCVLLGAVETSREVQLRSFPFSGTSLSAFSVPWSQSQDKNIKSAFSVTPGQLQHKNVTWKIPDVNNSYVLNGVPFWVMQWNPALSKCIPPWTVPPFVLHLRPADASAH